MISSCASSKPNVTALFVEPASLDGQDATACGLLKYGFENHNFYPDMREAKKDDIGIGVAPGEITYDQLRDQHDRRICISGVVRYSGCAVTAICTASNFAYEIVVNSIKTDE